MRTILARSASLIAVVALGVANSPLSDSAANEATIHELFNEIWVDPQGAGYPAGMISPQKLHSDLALEETKQPWARDASEQITRVLSSLETAPHPRYRINCRSSVCEAVLLLQRSGLPKSSDPVLALSGELGREVQHLANDLKKDELIVFANDRKKSTLGVLVYFYSARS